MVKELVSQGKGLGSPFSDTAADLCFGESSGAAA